MTNTMTAAKPEQSEFRRGAKPLITAFLTYGSGPIIFLQTNALFVAPIRAETGLSATQVQTGSIVNLLVAIAGVGVGFFVNKYGARRLVVTGFALMGVLALLLAVLPASAFMFYAVAALLGISGALCYNVPYSRLVSSWFQKNFGLAQGFMSAGASVTPLLMTPLIVWVIYGFGWRWGYVAIAVMVLVIALPLVIFGFHENKDDGGTSPSAGTVEVGISARTTTKDSLRYLADARVLMVIVGCAVATFAIGGIMSSVQPFLLELGHPVELATAMSMALLVGIIVGRIGGGSMLDKMWPHLVPLVVCIISGISAIMFSHMAGGLGVALLGVFVFLLGFAQGADADFPAFFILKFTSRVAFPVLLGVIGLATGVSTTLGALIAAGIKDGTGSYAGAFVMSGTAYCIAGLLLFITGFVRRKGTGASGPSGQTGQAAGPHEQLTIPNN